MSVISKQFFLEKVMDNYFQKLISYYTEFLVKKNSLKNETKKNLEN